MMVFVWLLSLAKRDVSIVDIYWGLGFVLIAPSPPPSAAGYSGRKLLLTWSRCGACASPCYLLWRNWGTGEDYRYRAMRKPSRRALRWREPGHRVRLQGA